MSDKARVLTFGYTDSEYERINERLARFHSLAIR